MSISAIVRRVRQRVRRFKKRLLRRASSDAAVATTLSTAVPAVSDSERASTPRNERERRVYERESYRSTPLISRGGTPATISLQDEERASQSSFRRTPSAEILALAPASRDSGTPFRTSDPSPAGIVLSVTNPDAPPSPVSAQSEAESPRATAPSLSSSAHVLPFEQEESAEETTRKREAALRMLEGGIPAVATGAYVRL